MEHSAVSARKRECYLGRPGVRLRRRSGVPHSWNVSRAVAESYAAGEPLHLAFYSADWAYHSGRYFWSSDHDEYPAEARPTLQVYWGDQVATLDKSVKPVAAQEGQPVTYTLAVVGSGRSLTLTDNLPVTVSAPGPIKVVGGGSASYQVGTHRIVWTGSVAAGQSVTVSFPVTLKVSTPLAIVNQAILSDPIWVTRLIRRSSLRTGGRLPYQSSFGIDGNGLLINRTYAVE